MSCGKIPLDVVHHPVANEQFIYLFFNCKALMCNNGRLQESNDAEKVKY